MSQPTGPGSGIRWHHHRDVCEARVGEALRWAPEDTKTGRHGVWRHGATVIAIEHHQCWEVKFDPTEPARGWVNPIMCGETVSFI
jgi:hypothetical protein